MKSAIKKIIILFLILVFCACAARQKNILEANDSQARIRSIQSRVFDYTDRNHQGRNGDGRPADIGDQVARRHPADQANGFAQGPCQQAHQDDQGDRRKQGKAEH